MTKLSDFAKTPMVIQNIEKMVKLFRTPAVRRIYLLLEQGDKTAEEIEKETELKRPTIYTILKQLKDFGVCKETKVAEKGKKFKYYSTRNCIIPQGFYDIYENLPKKEKTAIKRCESKLVPVLWECVNYLIEEFGNQLPQENACPNCKCDHGFFNAITNILIFSTLETLLTDAVFNSVADYWYDKIEEGGER